MHHGTHHLSRRVNRNGSTSFDRFMLVVGTVVPFLTLPQVIAAWSGPAEGLSLVSWVAYLIHSICWIAYGFVHRERILVGTNALWALMQLLVIIGIVT